jgi:nitrous oxidase accessory protein NosD
MALGVHNTLVDGLKVTGIGNEGIHFQYASSDNVVQNSEISDTGKDNGGFGEGIYSGSANSNWPGGQPDHSDRNKALDNKIGPNVRAEGTTGGELRGNIFSGNTADVQAPSAYGFSVVAAVQGNKVCASNTVTGAGKGFANVAATEGC